MPELVNINDWIASSSIEDPVEQKKKYAEYVRDSYLEDESYNEAVEQTLQRNLFGSLSEDGYTEDEIRGFLKPDPLPFERKAELVAQSGILARTPGVSDPLNAYFAFLKIKQTGEASADYLLKEDELFEGAQDVVNKNYNKALEKLLADGVTPFATFELPDGSSMIKGGPAADGLSSFEAYKASRDAGFISSEDAPLIEKAMSMYGDKNVPVWKYANYQQAVLALKNAEGNEFFDKSLKRYTNKLRGKRMSDMDDLQEDVVEELGEVFPDTLNIPLEDRLAAVDYIAGSMAMGSGVIKFDEDDLTKNVRKFGYGDVVFHQNLYAKRDVFEEAISNLTDDEKTRFRNERDVRLQGLYPIYTNTLNNTYLSSDWNDALTQGLAEGKKEHEILDEFLATTDYSAFQNEFVGNVLRSIPDAVTDTVAGVGAMANNEFSRDVLLANHKDRQARRQLAEMFGNKIGMVGELSAMVAPVVFDIGATALLTATTGVGGAGYVGLKSGARLTTKGMVQGMLGGALRRKTVKGVVETNEQVAERLVARNLIKDFGNPNKNLRTALKDIDDDIAKKVIKPEEGAAMKKALTDSVSPKDAARPFAAKKVIEQYSKVTGNRVAQDVAIFVPAATRSGSMTYASVYSTLPDDMPPEERHQKALYAGLAGAAITGSLVTGFRAIGMGGVEDWLVSRASGREVNRYLNHLNKRLTDRRDLGLPEEAVDLATAKIVARGLRRNWAKFVPTKALGTLSKGFAGEAAEEGLDEFINSFVQTKATGENMLFSDRVKHAGLAAFYGGVFGAAMPAFRGTFGRLVRGESAFDQQTLSKRETAKQVADELRRTGSDASAEAIEARFDQIEREAIARAGAKRPPAPPSAPAPTPETETTPVSEAAQAIPTGEELALGDVAGVAPAPPTVTRGETLEDIRSLKKSLETDPDNVELQAALREAQQRLEAGAADQMDLFATGPIRGETIAEIESLEARLKTDPDNVELQTAIAEARKRLEESPDQMELLGAVDPAIGTREAPEIRTSGFERAREPAFGPRFTEDASIEQREAEYQAWLDGIDIPVQSGERVGRVEIPLDPQHYFRKTGGVKEGVTVTLVIDRSFAQNADGSSTPITRAKVILKNPDGSTAGVNQFGQGDFYRGDVKLLRGEPDLFEAGEERAKTAAELDALAEMIIRNVEEATPEEHVEAYLAATSEKTKAKATRLVEEGVITAGEAAPVLSEDLSTPYGLPKAAADQIVKEVAESDPVLAQQLEFAIAVQLVSEEDLLLFQDEVNERGLDAAQSTKALNDYLAYINMRANDPRDVVRGYDPQRAAAGITLGEGGEEVAYTHSTLSHREAANMGLAQAALLTDEDSFKTTEEFAREILGLGKRDFSKIKKDIVTRQKEAYEQRLLETFSDQVEALINKGVRVNITGDQLYGFSPDLFSSSVFKTPRGEATSKKLEKLKAVNERINGKIEERFPTRNVVEAVKTDVPAEFKKGGQLKTGKSRRGVDYRYHPEWGGVFNNDPFSVADMLRKGLTVSIPEGVEGINPSFKPVEVIDPITKNKVSIVADVVAPHPVIPNLEYSLVHDVVIPPSVAKFFAKQTELNANLNSPDIALPLKSSLGRRDQGEVFVVFDPEEGDADGKITFRQMQDRLASLVGFGYSSIAEEGKASTGTQDQVSRELGINFAGAFMGVLESGPGTGLKGSSSAYSSARVSAIAEVVTSLEKFFKVAAIKQDLENKGALQRDDEGKITIKDEFVDSLFDYVGLPSRTIEKRFERGKPLPFETAAQKKAVFLLENGYLGSGERAAPIRKGRSSKPVPDWEKITVKDFFEKEFNHRSQRTSEDRDATTLLSSPDAEFPDLFHIIRSSGNRNRQRLRSLIAVENALSISESKISSYDEAQTKVDAVAAARPESLRSGFEETYDPSGAFGVTFDEVNEIDVGRDSKELSDLMSTISSDLEDVASSQRFKASIEDVILALGGELRSPETEKVFSVLSNKEKAELVLRAGIFSTNPDARRRLETALADKNKDELLPAWFINAARMTELDIPQSAKELGVIVKAISKKLPRRSAPSIISSKEVEFYRQKNKETVERLGLVSGDSSSVIEALQLIAGTSADPDNRMVAQLLLTNESLIRNTSFVIYDIEDGRAGFYDPLSPTVAVNLSGYYGDGVESVILHEYLHATTVGLLATPESDLSATQRSAKRKLVSLFEEIQSYRVDAPKSMEEFHHATKNLEEFIATYFSSNSFQNTLKNLSTAKGKPSLYRRVLDKILDFLASVAPAPFRRLIRRNTKSGREFREAFGNLTNFMAKTNAEFALDPIGSLPVSLIGAIESRKNRLEAHYKNVVKPFRGAPSSQVFDPDETVVMDFSADLDYMEAIKRGVTQIVDGKAEWTPKNKQDEELVRKIIADKIEGARKEFGLNRTSLGIRQGVYVNGVPLDPAFDNFYGPGYYVAEGTEATNAPTGSIAGQYIHTNTVEDLGYNPAVAEFRAEQVVAFFENPLLVKEDFSQRGDKPSHMAPYKALTTQEQKFVDHVLDQELIKDFWERAVFKFDNGDLTADHLAALRLFIDYGKNTIEKDFDIYSGASLQSWKVGAITPDTYLKNLEFLYRHSKIKDIREANAALRNFRATNPDVEVMETGLILLRAADPDTAMESFRAPTEAELDRLELIMDGPRTIADLARDRVMATEGVNITKAELLSILEAPRKEESPARQLARRVRIPDPPARYKKYAQKVQTFLRERGADSTPDLTLPLSDEIGGAAREFALQSMSLSNRFTELLHQAIGAKKLTTKETARAAKETGRTQAEQTMLSDKNQERALQYNTVIIKLIREGKLPYDSIQIPVDKKVKRFTSELVLPRPNQIKSAELIVTDSQGNIVLPSARFDPSDKSILHSSFEAIHSDITVSPERVSRVQSLADQAIKAIPPSVSVSVVETTEEAANVFEARPNAAFAAVLLEQDGETIPAIFVARENLVQAIAERSGIAQDDTNIKGVLEALISEELDHITEFKAIPLPELDAYIDTLSDAELDAIVDEYTINAKSNTLNAALKKGVAENNLETKRQVVGEMMRMHLQRITRGTTTEEDVAFYESNPSTVRIFLRYLAGVFRKFYAKYNLRRNNPELSQMINRMAYELKFLANGGAAHSVRLPFDPRDPDAGYNVLTRRFEASLGEIGEDTKIEEVIQKFKGMFDTLELPVAVFSKGKYKAYTGAKAVLFGDVDPRVHELKKKEQAFMAAVEKVGGSKLSEFERIRKKYGEVSDELIADATGSSSDAYVDSDFRAERRAEYMEWRRSSFGTPEEAKAAYKTRRRKYEEMVLNKIKAEEARLASEIEKKISSAREALERISPELASSVMGIRTFVDALSLVMEQTYGLKDKLRAKVDSQLGIYITRDYKVFNEEGYVDKILGDRSSKVYEEAYTYFENKWLNAKTRAVRAQYRRKEGKRMTYEDGRLEAQRELSSEKTRKGDPIEAAMQLYLHTLHARSKGDFAAAPRGVSRSLVDNLINRKNVPPVIQNLLGVYGPEEGIQNIFRTMGVVTRMVARQNFFNNLIQVGSDPDNDFMLTHEQITERIAEGNAEFSGWKNVRKGTIYAQDAVPEPTSELESDYDKTFNYYAPPEMVDGMRKMFAPEMVKEQTSATEAAISAGVGFARFATGVSLSAKTMGSVGFYIRNVLGNILFFAPAQGFGPISMMKIMSKAKHITKGFIDPNAFDEYYAELRAYNVIGGDLYASQIRELFTSRGALKKAEQEINALRKMARKAGKAVDKAVLKRLEALSQGVDAFYKIGYYEIEKDNILAAKKSDQKNGVSPDRDPLDDYSALTENEIKAMAAKKVRRTAQSYADTVYLVERLNKTWGAFLTPFLRFKTEILRITGNTYKLAREEMRSGNSVIRNRGLRRMTGINLVLFGFSMGASTITREIFGIGEDEDEFLRASGPDYKKYSTFYYLPVGDDLFSLDATFLNPFAPEVDPALRFLEHLSRGEPFQGVKAAVGSLSETYLDEQILAAALLDTRRNKRSDTGAPIYEEADGLTGYAKAFAYIAEEALAPRTPVNLYNAVKGLTGDQAPDPARDFGRSLLNEIIPAKPYKIDPEVSLQRFLEKKRDERNRATAALNVLKSRGALTEGEIRGAVRDWIQTRKRIDEEIHRAVFSANRLGLSPRQVRQVMSIPSLGMGPRRQTNIVRGEMDRPMFTKPFVEGVLGLTPDGRVGLQRLRVGQDEINKYGPSVLVLDKRDN